MKLDFKLIDAVPIALEILGSEFDNKFGFLLYVCADSLCFQSCVYIFVFRLFLCLRLFVAH